MTKIDRKFLLKDSIISVILISENDENAIEKVLLGLCKKLKGQGALHEIVIIDNNSTDQTVGNIRKLQRRIPAIRLIVLSKTYPRDIVLTAGLDSCIGDQVILYDKKFDTVDTIHLVLDKLYAGFDVVTVNIKRAPHIPTISRLFLWIVEKVSEQGFKYRPNFSMGLSRKAVNSITRVRRKSRNFSYLNFLIGLKRTTMEFSPGETDFKNTRPSFFKIFFETVDVVISNSFKPIRLIAAVGVFLSGLFLVYILFIVILMVVFGMYWIAPQGWISLATVMGTLFFLLFSVLTIISEYLIRIMEETREEPLYFISEEFDHTRLPKKKRLNVI